MNTKPRQSRPVLFSFLQYGVMLCCLLVFVPSVSNAQRPAALVRKGDQAMQHADYYTSLHYFRQAFEQKPAPDIEFRLAEAALGFKAYELAVKHYGNLCDGLAAAQYPAACLGLGLAYQSLGNYEAAATALETFIDGGRASKPQLQIAEGALQSIRWARQQEGKENWKITRLPRRINSAYGEFGAWKSGDTLFYTAYRYEKEDDKYNPPRKISKVMISRDERRGRLLGRGFNEDTIHTANVALNRDKSLLFFNRCQFTQGAEIRCQLCVRGKDRRGRWKKDFLLLPENVNIAQYTSTQPALLWDSITQQEFLLFVSDRPGGTGSFDLWQVPVPEEGAKWQDPQPIKALNTLEGEISPFFLANTQTLYYSTNTAPGFGGYDLVRAQYLGEGQWGDIENLGPALNSSYDDTYPFFKSEEVAYFSSNRPGGRYLDPDARNCCPDIFKAEKIPAVPLVDTTASVENIPPIPDEIPTVPPKPVFRTLEDFLPLTLFYDNDQPDPRTRKTVTKQSYEETYFSYLEREEVYYDQYAENEREQDAIAAFFEEEVVTGYERLALFSTILLEQLVAGQTVEIFLKGYTSPRAQGDYNLLLGKRRVSAVRNHFQAWQSGVLQSYIDEGRLIISEVSFGETKAAATARDERAGERLSIYSPEAARERRVEIVEIKRGQE